MPQCTRAKKVIVVTEQSEIVKRRVRSSSWGREVWRNRQDLCTVQITCTNCKQERAANAENKGEH